MPLDWLYSSFLYPTVTHWLLLSTLLFSIGLYGLLTRRSAIGMLLALEIMLNAGALNFVLFNRLLAPATEDGEIMTLFVIAVAAAEAVVAMAIFVLMFKQRQSLDVTEMNQLAEPTDENDLSCYKGGCA